MANNRSISLSIGNSPNSNASTTHIILHSSPSANTTTEQHRTPTRNNVNDIAHTDNNEIITTALSSNDRGNPPTYEEAVNPDVPPPSYDSLFGRVREARKSSSGILGFVMNVAIILLGTIGCSIIAGMTIVIPVCMVVFGFLYLNECPQNDYIPVYLLIGGLFGIIKQLLHLSTHVRSPEEQEAERLRQSPTQTLINCFMLGWFIIGSYWIYKEYEPNYDPMKGIYCNKSLYLFAFWLITSVYVFLGLVTVAICTATVAFASFLEPIRQATT